MNYSPVTCPNCIFLQYSSMIMKYAGNDKTLCKCTLKVDYIFTIGLWNIIYQGILLNISYHVQFH